MSDLKVRPPKKESANSPVSRPATTTTAAKAYGAPAPTAVVQVTDSRVFLRAKWTAKPPSLKLAIVARRAIPFTQRMMRRRLGNGTQKQLCRNESGAGKNDGELESGRSHQRSVGYRRPGNCRNFFCRSRFRHRCGSP